MLLVSKPGKSYHTVGMPIQVLLPGLDAVPRPERAPLLSASLFVPQPGLECGQFCIPPPAQPLELPEESQVPHLSRWPPAVLHFAAAAKLLATLALFCNIDISGGDGGGEPRDRLS